MGVVIPFPNTAPRRPTRAESNCLEIADYLLAHGARTDLDREQLAHQVMSDLVAGINRLDARALRSTDA